MSRWEDPPCSIIVHTISKKREHAVSLVPPSSGPQRVAPNDANHISFQSILQRTVSTWEAGGECSDELQLRPHSKTAVRQWYFWCVWKKIADGGSRNHGRLGQVGTASGGHAVDAVDIRAIYCVQYYFISKHISMHTTHKRHQCYERACVNAQVSIWSWFARVDMIRRTRSPQCVAEHGMVYICADEFMSQMSRQKAHCR